VFQVILSNRAKKSIKKYKKVQRSVLDLLITLQENPVLADHYDVKKIKGESARALNKTPTRASRNS
jgi:mRNA-degrading endonuclease RelE of RelBE toxin-antitoxin system